MDELHLSHPLASPQIPKQHCLRRELARPPEGPITQTHLVPRSSNDDRTPFASKRHPPNPRLVSPNKSSLPPRRIKELYCPIASSAENSSAVVGPPDVENATWGPSQSDPSPIPALRSELTAVRVTRLAYAVPLSINVVDPDRSIPSADREEVLRRGELEFGPAGIALSSLEKLSQDLGDAQSSERSVGELRRGQRWRAGVGYTTHLLVIGDGEKRNVFAGAAVRRSHPFEQGGRKGSRPSRSPAQSSGSLLSRRRCQREAQKTQANRPAKLIYKLRNPKQ